MNQIELLEQFKKIESIDRSFCELSYNNRWGELHFYIDMYKYYEFLLDLDCARDEGEWTIRFKTDSGNYKELYRGEHNNIQEAIEQFIADIIYYQKEFKKDYKTNFWPVPKEIVSALKKLNKILLENTYKFDSNVKSDN